MRRRTLVAALAAGLLITGPALAGEATAARLTARLSGAHAVATMPTVPAGWSLIGSTLFWRALRRIPTGDAAVEFWAGRRFLGRPWSTPDGRTFSLSVAGQRSVVGRLSAAGRIGPITGLAVRAGGRRLDVGRPAARRFGPIRVPPLAPLNPVDPGEPGRYATVAGEYALPSVRLPHLPVPVEMRALVIAPRAAPGRRPLVLFLHGRHDTCRGRGVETIDWPCPAGSTAIPSHHGYQYAQRLLASQGYDTVSIAANGVNGQDGQLDDSGAAARSRLIRLHLTHWSNWSGGSSRGSAPAIVRAVPPADLSRVLLVGHSRGGEGVDQAATDSLSPPPGVAPARWTIRGVVLIGATSYNQNPAPDVPSVSLLPGCDGDVADLAGQVYVDGTRGVSRGAALHSAIYLAGADHNFFSTEWTSDDADYGDDPVCAPGVPARLTAAQQQRVGATYVAAGARLFVAGDDRVRPLLDGSGYRARSAGPAVVHSDALGGARTPLVIPGPSVMPSGARLCEAVSDDPAVACLDPGEDAGWSPHFVPFGPIVPETGRQAIAIDWSAPGRPVGLRLAAPRSVLGARSVTMRIIVPPGSAGTRLGVILVDRRGRRADLGELRLDGLAAYWGQEVRVPLAAAHRLDRAHIAALRLVPRTGRGRAWLLDAWAWRPGTPAPRPIALPRVDLGTAVVAEGGRGRHRAAMPVTVSGHGTGLIRVWMSNPRTDRIVSRLVTVRAGARTAPIRVSWTGNRRHDPDAVRRIMVKAVRGVVVGNSRGTLRIRDDDRRGPRRYVG